MEIPINSTLDWITQSLEQGGPISSAALTSVPLRQGRVYVLVPEESDALRVLNFEEGGVTQRNLTIATLVRLLGDLALAKSAKCLVVEDDLMRPSDPAVNRRDLPSAFLDEHILHWAELEVNGGGSATSRAIQLGATGYPLNAFVATSTRNQLGLNKLMPVPRGLPNDIVNSLVAMIFSAFDAESFVVWIANTPTPKPHSSTFAPGTTTRRRRSF